MDGQGIDRELQEDVYGCATSYEGQDLLNEMGVKTHALDPVLSFVPWVTFNGVGMIYHIQYAGDTVSFN